MPTVSIVIATYKTPTDYIQQTISSAINQTWKDIEILISDDSPDDRLASIIAKFGDSRITYFHNSPSLGVAQNHWSTFLKAKGEYVAVLNHDDWFEPFFLERLVLPLIQNPNLVISFCDHWVIDSEGIRLESETDLNSKHWGRTQLAEGIHLPFFQLLANQSIPMVMGAVFRKNAVPPQLPQNAGPAYDLWLTYLLARTGSGAFYISERLSAWRAHPNNLTSQGGIDWSEGAANCWNTIRKDAALFSIRNEAKAKASSGYATCAIQSWRSGKLLKSVRFAIRSLSIRWTRRGLSALVLSFTPRRIAQALGIN